MRSIIGPVCMLQRIVEKYHRNEKVPAYKDIAIREFMMVEYKINIKFHYNKGQSTRTTRTFVEPLIAIDRLVFDSSMTYGYHVSLFLSTKIYLFVKQLEHIFLIKLRAHQMITIVNYCL